jgi:hypothetical protein
MTLRAADVLATPDGEMEWSAPLSEESAVRRATESCPGSQYWGGMFTAAGLEVRILTGF